MRVVIIYNEPEPTPPGEHWLLRSEPNGSRDATVRDASEYGVLGEVRLIEAALVEAGYECVVFAANDTAELCAFLARERPDAIFNCCESLRGSAALEMHVAGLFELFGIPYTGSPALALGAALNKGIMKALLQAYGVPTPPYAIVHGHEDIAAARALRFPLIVKPLCEDASIGIDANAVVIDDAALLRRLRFVLAEFAQPALVEEYIDGRELNVSLLAASPAEFLTLPVSEILFDGLPPGAPRIVTYEAKWVEDSTAYCATVARCPAALDPALEERALAMALAAAHAIGVRDYGRVDLRVRAEDDAVFVLEVNPNPDLNDDAGFLRAARASGRTYASTALEILECCLERSGLAAPRGALPAAVR